MFIKNKKVSSDIIAPGVTRKIVIDLIETVIPHFAVSIFIDMFGYIIEILWYTGVPILIFLAMLQKIDRSLYEAASIDGANAWSIFWKITLPIIRPAITVSIIFIVVFLAICITFLR